MSSASGSTSAQWVASVRALLARDLATLRRQLEAYPDDASLWALPPGLPNSGGTLVQHCCGNLRHFVGATLGGTGYVRDRDAEFAVRHTPRAALAALLEATASEVDAALAGLDPARLEASYALPVVKGEVDTGDWLVHLCTHLAYHLGQVDYHRRVVTGDGTGVDAVSTKGVGSFRRVVPPRG